MDTEQKPANHNRFSRVIIVKKKPKTGIDRFDEYIQKSGLEPKSYQREGVEFCLRREKRCTENITGDDRPTILGGIIADEMGLGKTIVMMGLILANLAAFRRTLIVVPVALIAQWVAQLKKTIIDTGVKSDLTICVFHGSTGKRSVILLDGVEGIVWCHRPPKKRGGSAAATVSDIKAVDIVITTYGCVAMEEPAKEPKKAPKNALKTPTLSLRTFRAHRIIFDEAHHLRNKSSRIFKGAIRTVSATEGTDARRPSVWIVTGTPIQNKISDLKSLCYVLGFCIGDLSTEEKRRAVRDEYVLRRTKVSVGMVAATSGPDGTTADYNEDIDIVCAPRLQSLKHYKSNVAWTSENELDLSREIHRKARTTNDRAERLKLYTNMRQMCVWPALLEKIVPTETDDNTMTHGLSMEEFKVAVSKQSKIDKVVETIITEAAAAETGAVTRKSIIFCHFRREMTQLRDMLLRCGVVAGGGIDDIALIDGTVRPRERARIFAALPTVLILQIRTCSEGLNLQSYSDVYFVSPHWNPCVEDQAIARCYRMGQTSQVRVFRFYMSDFVIGEEGNDKDTGAVLVDGSSGSGMCISTLDHKCEEIQEKKRVLCNEFLCGV